MSNTRTRKSTANHRRCRRLDSTEAAFFFIGNDDKVASNSASVGAQSSDNAQKPRALMTNILTTLEKIGLEERFSNSSA